MKPWILVFHPMTIAHLISYKGVLQFAILDNDKKEVEVLLKAGINPNQYEGGSLPLHSSVIADTYACTVLLLKYGANPDLIVNIDKQEKKIIQSCIPGKDNNTIIILAMYGATNEAVQFPAGFEEQKALLLATMQKKAMYDQLLNQAMAYEKDPSPNFKLAISSYQAAGDIWYQLSAAEENSIYQKHYQEKALELYESAAACYKKLAAHAPEPAYYELFSRMAEIYHAQGHKAKELETAKLAAQNAVVSNKAYPLPQLFPVSPPNDNSSAASLRLRKAAHPEQQALLQASTSLRV